MQKSALRLVVPTPINGTVPPRRKPNSETRDREHLTEAEVERLMKAAGENRYGHREATMILIAFRHGLRPVEVCNLKWDSIDLAKARIHVNRAKNTCSARLRLQAGQCGARHPGASALPGPQEHSAHRPLYQAVAGSVPRFLARLSGQRDSYSNYSRAAPSPGPSRKTL